MKDFSNLLKTPLYRILFNFPIGVIAFVILNCAFNNTISLQLPITTNHTSIHQSIDNHTHNNTNNNTGSNLAACINSHCKTDTYSYSNTSTSGDIYWLIYITLAILIGEIVSFIGEIPVNALFDYDPLTANCKTINKCVYTKSIDCPLELITPECDIDSKTNNQIFYSDLQDPDNTSSEIHFSMSRMLAGFGFEMGLISFATLCYTVKTIKFDFFGFLFLLVFILLLCKLKGKSSLLRESEKTYKKILLELLDFANTICSNTICLIVIIFYLFYLYCHYDNKCFFISSLFLFISIFSYIASIYYRAHANKLTAASRG